jgi:transcriptional regulator with XRE-family HTH domain
MSNVKFNGIGARIRQILEDRQIPLEALEVMCGIDSDRLPYVMNGGMVPLRSDLHKLVVYLGINPLELVQDGEEFEDDSIEELPNTLEEFSNFVNSSENIFVVEVIEEGLVENIVFCSRLYQSDFEFKEDNSFEVNSDAKFCTWNSEELQSLRTLRDIHKGYPGFVIKSENHRFYFLQSPPVWE